MPRDLWAKGQEIAENPSIGKSIRHSAFLDSYRRQKGLGALTNLAKKGIKVGISFIPLPIVKDVVGLAFDKGLEKARAKYVKYKKGKHLNDQMQEGRVKWGWKDIDLSDFDRYRWKIWHANKELVDVIEYLNKNAGNSASACNDVVRACYKYHYLLKRMQRFRSELDTVKELIEQTEAWMSQVESAVEQNNYYDMIDDFVQDAMTSGSQDPMHLKCDKDKCAHQTKERFWSQHQTALGNMGTVAKVFSEFAEMGAEAFGNKKEGDDFRVKKD